MTTLPRGEANYLAARPKGDVTTLKPSTEKSGYAGESVGGDDEYPDPPRQAY